VREQRLSAGHGGALNSAFKSFLSLFSPEISRRTMVGLLVAASMMIGAFGGATLLPVWVRSLVSEPWLAVRVTSRCFMLMNVGAIAGYLALIWLTDAIGRRWPYFLMALGCAAANLFMFMQIRTETGLLWFAPIYGVFVTEGSARLLSIFPNCFRRVSARPAKALLECGSRFDRSRTCCNRSDRQCYRLSASCGDSRHGDLSCWPHRNLAWSRDQGRPATGLRIVAPWNGIRQAIPPH
jgi:hypothetical protein